MLVDHWFKHPPPPSRVSHQTSLTGPGTYFILMSGEKCYTKALYTLTRSSKSEAHALTIAPPCLSLFLLQASRTAGLRDTYATAGLVTARLIVTLRSLSQSSRQLSPSQIWGEHAYCRLRAYNSVQLCGTVKGQNSSLLAFKWWTLNKLPQPICNPCGRGGWGCCANVKNSVKILRTRFNKNICLKFICAILTLSVVAFSGTFEQVCPLSCV